MINLYNTDCIAFMKSKPANYYKLAIVDPPYGLPKASTHGRGKLKNRIINRDNIKRWDIPPNKEYFQQLTRVSENQIIWGGNYFDLPPTRGFVVWDKKQPFPNFSSCEYAWMSFQVVSKIFKYDNRISGKIHPCQKPVKLYEWLLENYTNKGDKILDTHGGSMSSVIASINMEFDMDCCELDKDYFKTAVERVKKHAMQVDMFREQPIINIHGGNDETG